MNEALRWGGFAVSVVVAVGAFSSVLRTLVVPRGFPSRLAFLVGRAVWTVLLVIARRRHDYRGKDRVLAVGAPLTLVANLATWVVLFVIAYGLVSLPFHDHGLVTSLHHSGSALFTLGLAPGVRGGSVVVHFLAAAPGSPWWRW